MSFEGDGQKVSDSVLVDLDLLNACWWNRDSIVTDQGWMMDDTDMDDMVILSLATVSGIKFNRKFNLRQKVKISICALFTFFPWTSLMLQMSTQ